MKGLIPCRMFLKFVLKVSYHRSLQSYSRLEPQTCLIRENTSSLLLHRNTSSAGTQKRGTAAARKEVTVLGPTNMVLPNQSVVSEERKKGREKEKSSQVVTEVRLKVI